MAPSAVSETASETSAVFTYDKPSKTKFPDGYKTSGQRNPEYDLLKPYSEFPKQITGPTLWRSEDYQHNPERWTHHFSDEEVAELSQAADNFMSSGTPLTGITKV